MSASDQNATYSILIDIKARLDELAKARAEMRGAKQDGESLGSLFKTGLGIGGGMEVARKAVELVKEAVKAAFESAEEIKDASGNLGLSTDAYQTLRSLIRETGGDMGALTGALNTQQRTLVDAANNAIGPAAAAYNSLGLSVERLQGMTLERQFAAVARAIADATNKQEAFRSASIVLGERNLPRLRSALRELGEDGYDMVKAKADASIMSPEAVARLTAFVDAGKRAKDIFVASAGETFASALNFFGQPKPEIAVPPQPSAAEIAAAKQLAQQQKELYLAQYSLQRANQDQGNITADVTNTALEAQQKLDKAYDRQITALEKIIALRKAMPLDTGKGETADQRQLELLKLSSALWAAQNGARENLGAASTDYLLFMNRRRVQEAGLTPSEISLKEANEINQGDKNPNYVSAGGGVAFGAANYVNQLGSQGEQVAAALQNSIGATVSNISDGIYGWITGTMTFGQAMVNLGATVFKTILNTIVQMGVQWLVQAALIKTGMISIEATGDSLRAGRVIKENAAETAMMPAKAGNAVATGISSWGLALIFGALALAMIMSISGGFATGGFFQDRPAGFVSGPGTGTSDSILARVSNKEWIAPEWMTTDPHYGPVIAELDAARQGAPGYAKGGFLSFLVNPLQLGGFGKEFLKYAGVPRQFQPLAGLIDKYNFVDGTAYYGKDGEPGGSTYDPASGQWIKTSASDRYTVAGAGAGAGSGAALTSAVAAADATDETRAAGGGSAALGNGLNVAFLDSRNRDAVEDFKRNPEGEAWVVDVMMRNRLRLGIRT